MKTREAITVYQRQQGIAVTGSIDMRTVSSLGVSGRLSQQASQSIQSQSSSTGAQTTQPAPRPLRVRGRPAPVPLRARRASLEPAERDRSDAEPEFWPGAEPAVFDDGTELAQSAEHDRSADQPSQSGSSSTANQPSANQSTSPSSSSGSGSSKN